MAKGGGKRSYTRDSNGRFASGGGKSGATKGGTLAARSSLKRSKAKNVPGASRQQAGAVTRANAKLSSAMKSSKRTGPAMAGVIRGKAANQVIRQAGKARAAAGSAAEAAAKKRGWNRDSQSAAFLRAAKKQRANQRVVKHWAITSKSSRIECLQSRTACLVQTGCSHSSHDPGDLHARQKRCRSHPENSYPAKVGRRKR